MGIEFATIGTILFLIKLTIVLTTLYCALKLVTIQDKKTYRKYLWGFLVGSAVFFLVPSSITPKLTLEPDLPRVEYPQSEIIIEKPKDRVEYLPGFVPMGEKSE